MIVPFRYCVHSVHASSWIGPLRPIWLSAGYRTRSSPLTLIVESG